MSKTPSITTNNNVHCGIYGSLTFDSVHVGLIIVGCGLALCIVARSMAVPCACSSLRRWRCKAFCVWSSDVGKWRPERIGEPSEDHVLKKAHIAVHGHQHIRRCGSTKIPTGASHVLWDPSPGGAGEQPNANASVDGRARASLGKRGRRAGRERATSPAVSGNDAASTTLRSLATHSPFLSLSLWSSFSPFGSVAAKVGSSEERTSSVVGRFRRETRRQERRGRDHCISGQKLFGQNFKI